MDKILTTGDINAFDALFRALLERPGREVAIGRHFTDIRYGPYKIKSKQYLIMKSIYALDRRHRL